MSTPAQEPTRRTEEMSTPQLISQAMENVTSLVQDEMALAKTEIQQTVRDAGIGAGMFGAAGVLALYGLGALVATLILALSLLVDAWLAGLIVTVVLFAIAAVVALMGKKKVDAATPPVEKTKANVQRDIKTVKGAHR